MVNITLILPYCVPSKGLRQFQNKHAYSTVAQMLMEADPLTISISQISVRTVFEKSIFSKENHEIDCNCSQLHEIHGDRLYPCSRPGCFRYRNGFEAKAERDRHLSVHSRPFKCDDEKCDFFKLGFRPEAQLQAHFLRNYQDVQELLQQSRTRY